MIRPTTTTVERNGRTIEVSTLPYQETCLFWKRHPGHTREISQVVDTSGAPHSHIVAGVREGLFDKAIAYREAQPA